MRHPLDHYLENSAKRRTLISETALLAINVFSR
jgi:hypothetical protein